MPLTKRVVFVIPHQRFRDEEYFEPKRILIDAGYGVTTASTYLTPAAGKLGGQTDVDMLFTEIDATEFDAIVFVGGPGVVAYWDDPRTQALAKLFRDFGKVVAAECSAPVILANAGLLEGVSSTSFPGDADKLKAKGAVYTEAKVEWSAQTKILTANGPEAAKDFGRALVEILETGDYAQKSLLA